MKLPKLIVMFLASVACMAQSAPQPLLKLDDRLKVDLLLIVAHPDDETGATAYLAQLQDQHKRVAVVYLTHGEAGHNNMGPERAISLGAVREQELRHSLVSVGIENVWFLSGRDTPSQNVLQSLGTWHHGAALEEVVRMVRLTRPEVIITWLPSVFIGENHGDHQAAGVLATEAFDMAGDPAVFPAQLAGAMKVNETLLDGLQPWQTKKIYYFSDASDDAQFKGHGPTYPVNGISPTRHVPYWRIAMDGFRFHLTQYKSYIDTLEKKDDVALAEDWAQPVAFIFGKSNVGGSETGDVFEGVPPGAIAFHPPMRVVPAKDAAAGAVSMTLAGVWGFYESFRLEHELQRLPKAAIPEIAIKKGELLQVPLDLRNNTNAVQQVTITTTAPEGWTVQSGPGGYTLDAQNAYHVQVGVTAPKAESKDLQDIECRAESGGKVIGTVKLRVRVRGGGLPQ